MSAQHTTAARGIARAIRQLTVGYVRKRHEDRKTRETRRYTRHAAPEPERRLAGAGGVSGRHAGQSLGVAREIE